MSFGLHHSGPQLCGRNVREIAESNFLYGIIGIPCGYATRSGRHPEGSQRPGGPARRPLTSRGMSAWPYRVTTKYSFYPVHTYKTLNKKRALTVLWNEKYSDLMANYLSTLVWRRLPSELTSPVKWSPRAGLCSISQGLHLAHKKPEYEYGFIPCLVIKKTASKSSVYIEDWRPAFTVTSQCLGIPLRSARVAPLFNELWEYYAAHGRRGLSSYRK